MGAARCVRAASITSHANWRLSGSIPVVGSSSIVTFGSPMNEIASERRRFIPPEYVPAAFPATAPCSFTPWSSVSACSFIAAVESEGLSAAKSSRCSRAVSSPKRTSC